MSHYMPCICEKNIWSMYYVWYHTKQTFHWIAFWPFVGLREPDNRYQYPTPIPSLIKTTTLKSMGTTLLWLLLNKAPWQHSFFNIIYELLIAISVSILSASYSLEKNTDSGGGVTSDQARTCTWLVHVISRLISLLVDLWFSLVDLYFGIVD